MKYDQLLLENKKLTTQYNQLLENYKFLSMVINSLSKMNVFGFMKWKKNLNKKINDRPDSNKD